MEKKDCRFCIFWGAGTKVLKIFYCLCKNIFLITTELHLAKYIDNWMN